MSTLDERLREQLLAKNDDYRNLFEQHQDQERLLELLNQKDFISQEEEANEKRIKLSKLHLKDQMEAIFLAAQNDELDR